MVKQNARLGIVAAGLLIFLTSFIASTPATTAPLHHAGLVVRHSSGVLITRTVAFGEDTITGLDLLQRSGLAVVIDTTSGIGAVVAQIDGEGCNYPKEPAFCKCQGRPCIYWNYYHQRGGAWAYSSLGASGSLIKDGDVDAWGWGDGSTGAQIPVIPFSRFYSPPPTATPIPPTATATAVPPTATATPIPPTKIPPTATIAPPRDVPPTATQSGRDTPPTITATSSASACCANPTPAVTATSSASACCANTPPTATVTQLVTNTAIVAPETTAPVVAFAPTDVPTPSVTPALPQPVTTPAAPPDSSPPIFGYAVFGVVALGLGGFWFWNSRKR